MYPGPRPAESIVYGLLSSTSELREKRPCGDRRDFLSSSRQEDLSHPAGALRVYVRDLPRNSPCSADHITLRGKLKLTVGLIDR